MSRFPFKRGLALVFLLLLVGSAYFAISATVAYLQRGLHDLREINEAAQKFVAHENAINDTAWEAGSVNLKVIVPRCVTPLKAGWETRFWYDSGSEAHRVRVIKVTCSRTWYLQKERKRWDVDVPVTQRN